MLAAAGMFMVACTDDYKDWSEPQGYQQAGAETVVFQAASVGQIDLTKVTDDEIVIFNPTITAAGQTTTTYDVAIYNEDKTDSVVIKAKEGGLAKRAEVQGALVALFGPTETPRVAPMTVTSYTLVNGTAVRNTLSGLNLSAIPKYQELPPVWYILGNCIGRGTWVNNKKMGVYTSTVAMYVNPYNYEELVYASYMQDATEFYIAPELGNKKNIIGADDDGNIWYQDDTSAEAKTPKNITIKDAGYYKIAVNVNTKEVTITPIAGDVKLYTSMAMAGIESTMEVITKAAKGENHDWLGDVTIAEDGKLVGFAGEGDGFNTQWGGKAFPAGKAIAGGNLIPTTAGHYKVVFNDLLGVYRFIKVEE